MKHYLAVLALSTAVLFATCITACNESVYPDREPTYIHNVAADSIVFWPPGLKYAREGDTVSFLVIGLQRGYVCSKIQILGWTWNDQDPSSDYYRVHSLIQVPGNPTCALDTKGLDSLFKATFPTPSGQKLYLQTSAGLSTDSLLYVAGNGYTEVFKHLVSGPDSAAFGGRFMFHDSGAGSVRRYVTADSMAACETFQSAAFKRNGDTLTVRVKRIEALPLNAAVFTPCAGAHADTMDVVFDRYRYP